MWNLLGSLDHDLLFDLTLRKACRQVYGSGDDVRLGNRNDYFITGTAGVFDCTPNRFADQTKIVDTMLDDGILRQRLNPYTGRLEPLAGDRQFQHFHPGAANINTERLSGPSAKNSHKTSVPRPDLILRLRYSPMQST